MKEALKKFGARCPHCEKVVAVRKELWHCHGCGRGGNVYRFIADKTGLNYLEAYYRYGDREFD